MSKARRPQRSKADRWSTKVHDRIALARCEAAIRREQDSIREEVFDTFADLAYA